MDVIAIAVSVAVFCQEFAGRREGTACDLSFFQKRDAMSSVAGGGESWCCSTVLRAEEAERNTLV